MNRQRGFISNRDFQFFMFMLVLVGMFVGAVLFLGIPWLWGILRPFIHAWTA